MKKPTAWVLTAEDDVSIQAIFYRIHFKMEDNMELLNLSEELKNNAYPGRGIVIGKTPDGKQAVTAYFIMGRSSNSRNRVFVEEGEGIRTQAFDPSKLEDPSLIMFETERMEIFAPINSWHLDNMKNRQLKVTDYSSGVAGQPDRRYVMIYSGDRKIIFEPSEAMVKALQSVAPRKVFFD